MGEHGVGLCPFEPRHMAVSIIADEIPMGVTYENGFKTPQTFYSKSAYERALKENGLTRTERFCPTPGTDTDPAGIPNPQGYMDPTTLENARILLSRASGATEEQIEAEGKVIRGRFNIVGEKDAMAVATGTDTKRMSRIGRRLKDDGARHTG